MFEALGKRVIYLKRISMGPLNLPDDLETGGLQSFDTGCNGYAYADKIRQIK